MVAVYEEDEEGVEQLVHRPMNDEEYTELKERRKEWAKNPLIPPPEDVDG
jgi:hypothetical protein